jgi:glycosyltransferase involved in cell wall biosynthesis
VPTGVRKIESMTALRMEMTERRLRREAAHVLCEGGAAVRTPVSTADPRGHILVLWPFPVLGAAEAYALTLAEGILGRGWKLTLLVPNAVSIPGGGRAIESLGGEILAVPGSHLRSPFALRSLLRHVGADIVHVNDVFLPGIAASTHRGSGPTVVTCHTPALQVRYSRRGRALRRWSVPRVDAWIALTGRNAALLAEQHPIATSRIRVIRPGLPASRFRFPHPVDARRSLGLPDDAFVVGTAGRIAHQKRHDLLIRAAALASDQVPSLRVVVLGDGELRSEMEALAEATVPGRVLFAGHRNDVPALLPAFDVFCLPSDFEGLPFALLEAMATGRPIVVTDVQGSGEAIADGVHGLVVPPGAPEPVAGAIVRLASDPELAENLGRHAKARFFAEFTAGPMIDRTIDLYVELLCRAGWP